MGDFLELFARLFALVLFILAFLGVIVALTGGLRWSDVWLALPLIVLLTALPMAALYFLQSYANLPFRIPLAAIPLIPAGSVIGWLLAGPFHELTYLRRQREKIKRYRESLDAFPAFIVVRLARIEKIVEEGA